MRFPGPRRRGRHRRSDLPRMLVALDEAVQALAGRADPALLDRARAVEGRAGQRLRLSGEHTVVALAGSTGSGKSSLFNALAGAEFSPVGLRRPTTSTAHALVRGPEGAAALVQWLGVPRRRTVWQHRAEVATGSEPGGLEVRDELAGSAEHEGLDGLVLLDLPDHDSTSLDHRLEVDRLVERVDLLVWVVDPQKYADEVLHERYLRRLTGHDAVTVVVLNQLDTLDPAAGAQCTADLRRLLDQDGLPGAPVVPCSARTGSGLAELRTLLTTAVARRQARNDRLVADVESVVDALASAVSPVDAPDISSGRGQLVEALSASAGVPVIGSAVEQSWRRQAEGSLGWPPTRWVRRLRPDPLRRLHLGAGERREMRSLVRSSVPEPTPVQRAQVESAVRRVYDGAAAGLTPRWQQSVRHSAGSRSEDVTDALDAAVTATDLGQGRRPAWWRVASSVQWLLVTLAVVGAGWLLLLAVGSYLRLPDAATPSWRGVPLPTALLVGGVAAGLVLAFVGRAVARAGALVRRRRAEARLRSGIEAVADRLVLGPVAEELARHERARQALSRAASG